MNRLAGIPIMSHVPIIAAHNTVDSFFVDNRTTAFLKTVTSVYPNFDVEYGRRKSRVAAALLHTCNHNCKMFTLCPSDAFQLTAFLLNKDPCQRANEANAPNKPYSILLISRRGTRRTLNSLEVIDELKTQYPSAMLREFFFEDLPVQEQFEAMESADLVVAVHGSALATSFMLHPCSGIIEIVPHGYCFHEYFLSISRSLGIYHQLFFTAETVKGACDSFGTNMSFVREEIKKKTDQAHRSHELYELLMTDPNCHPAMYDSRGRDCLRHDPVFINTSLLLDAAHRAVVHRRTCLSQHPLYSQARTAS